MKILGIETSCDETAAAIVENGQRIISNTLASSAEMHAKTGGIIPEQAAREQIKSIIPVLKETLAKTDYPKEIDAIAVTVGPGLVGSLLVGIETAKTLAVLWQKPIIPVNHLVAHIYANFLENTSPPEFPAIALVVSGGHTDLVYLENHGKLKKIGGTRDDAAGEAFDKTARILGLTYPGGPAIAKAAENFNPKKPIYRVKLPRPLMGEPNFDWSFSGLKTAVLREVEKFGNKLDNKAVEEISYEIQESIADVLIYKTLRAVQIYKPKSLLLAGGVSANKVLRDKFKLKIKKLNLKTDLFFPKPVYCTDNATYIASCAYYNLIPVTIKRVSVIPELSITDRTS